MAEPRNTGIEAPRQEVGTLVAPHVPAAMPNPVKPFDMASAVLDAMSGIGQVATTYGRLTEDERRQKVFAERADMAQQVADFDFSKVQQQGQETRSQALLRTLKGDDRFSHLEKETQAGIYESLVDKMVRLDAARAKEADRGMAWDEQKGFTVMLADPTQRATAIAGFKGYYERAIRSGLTEQQARQPIENALLTLRYQGKTKDIEDLRDLAVSQGLQSDYEHALEQSKEQARTLADRERIEREKAEKAQVDAYKDRFSDAMSKMMSEGTTADALAEFVTTGIKEVAASNIPGSDKKQIIDNLQNFRRQESSIDYTVLNGLQDEVLNVRYGGADNAKDIESRIKQAWAGGSLGWGPAGVSRRETLLNRLRSQERAALWSAVELVLQQFKGSNREWEYGSLLKIAKAAKAEFLFKDDLESMLAEHPEWTPKQAYVAAAEKMATYEANRTAWSLEVYENEIKRRTAPSTQPARVKVNSPEEARKLPSGTLIELPDGSPGVVP